MYINNTAYTCIHLNLRVKIKKKHMLTTNTEQSMITLTVIIINTRM